MMLMVELVVVLVVVVVAVVVVKVMQGVRVNLGCTVLQLHVLFL